MAKIKNLNDAIVREPETAGAEIERKGLGAKDANRATTSPKTAGAAPDREPRRIVMPPKPEPNEEPPIDAPTWTPDVREPDPDLLPDELPLPNPDENRDPSKRALP